MDRRLEFQDILEGVLGSENVYFQPTPNTKMQYPAIIFTLNNLNSVHANNTPYTVRTSYLVTHISRDPDDRTPRKLAHLKSSNFDRRFVAEGLNHTVFNIYY